MIDAIVRVSFQSDSTANQEASRTLTGDRFGNGPGPFRTGPNTALYHCPAGADAAVLDSLRDFLAAMRNKANVVDYISITLIRLPDPPPAPPGN